MVGIWIVLVGLLAFQGRNLEQQLNLRLPIVDGSQTQHALDVVEREFGGDYAVIVMLRGPRGAVERQGRELTARFNHTPRLHAISPWSPGAAIDGLAPSPGVAALVVRAEHSSDERIKDYGGPIRRVVSRVVAAPVHPSLAGLSVLGDSYRRATNESAKLGELIGIPLLLLILLLVFRSVLAAVLPVLVGGAVVMAARGVLSLLVGSVSIDLFSVGVAGMMGLALGVDYSLLVISRFREERGADKAEAMRSTVEATARSVLPAGAGLALAMLVSILVVPARIADSVAVTVLIVTALSVLSAMFVTPALLTLVGPNLDRWSLPPRRSSTPLSLRWSRRLAGSRRAVVSIVIGMLLCSALAFTLNTAVLAFELLPSGDPSRRQQEDVKKSLGPGWIAPIEVVVNGSDGPLTTPARLRALAAFQRKAEADPGVSTVAGFGKIAGIAKGLSGIEGELAAQERGLARLSDGISRLHDGAELSSGGLLKAAEGARALDAGLGQANTGAGLLANGMQAVGTGSSRLTQGLGRADDGSGKLVEGATKASSGAGRLAGGLSRAKKGLGEVEETARLLETAMESGDDRLAELHSPIQDTGSQLDAAWHALQRMSAGRSDPEYGPAVRAVEEAIRRLDGTDVRTGERPDPSYEGVEKGVERAEGQFGVGRYLSTKLGENGEKAGEGIEKLTKGADRLDRGLRRLAAGSRQLSGGIAKLSHGGQRLTPAMERLAEGTEQLSGGLDQLEGGAGQLAGGLGGGAQKSKLLTGALHKIAAGLQRQSGGGEGGSQLKQLQAQSPGLFRSGYFVLAGLDGSRPEQREQLGFLLNLERGALAARMLVIPRAEPSSDEMQQTKERLERDAAELSRETGTEVFVGGLGPDTVEINDTLRENAPILRIALMLITVVVLLLVMRSLLLPLIAALLNVVAVSASFGLLALVFNNSLLGGPGFVEGAIVPGAVIVIFGLAIDYEVFVFARIREEYLRTGSTRAAIANGLEHTAPVVTGAATIMIAVFLSFSVSDFMVLRSFGVVLALSVFLDAFIVRLVLIPALMRWLGDRSWWIPGWLDRLLPGGKRTATPGGKPEAEAA